MGLSMILAIARAEMRSVRRLVRYWIFSVLSIGITCLIYLYYAAIHGFVSRLSATVGAAGPRFLISALGIYVLAIFLLGLIFLAFDVRARDERERMAQVLDSRPLSNVELLVGRSLGLVFMAWVPVLVAMSLMQVFGGLALAFGWWLGEPVEPYSLIGFVVFDALTAFAVWCSLIVLLAVLLGNRLLVAISALVLLGLEVWSVLRMPVYLVPALGMVSAGAGLGSDVVPLVTTGAALTQRLSLWVLAAGFVALAAAFHPRPDGGARNRLIAVGAALVLVAGVTIGGLTWRAASAMQLQEVWEQVHRERSHEPRARIVAVGGSVEIDPGRRLDLDLQIRLQAPEDQSLDTLLFAFNPGLRVESVSVGGAEVDWTHALGLLEISLARPLQAGASATLNLVSRGKPDNSFAYLDSSVNLLAGNSMDAQVGLLGIQSGVFSRRYVALMPGIRWLPYAGTDIPNGDSRVRPADYFEVDLEVEVPRGWLVAGPGKRQTVSDSSRDGDRRRFRFHPGAPVSEVGLLASRFVRRSTEVAGVELELLVNAKHQRNLDLFADAAQVLESRFEEILGEAERLGLPYPYGALSLVETPSALRGYGGGWRLDTVQSLPGVLLLRENSFPTARFEFEFRNPERFEDREGGIEQAKVEALERFFENDFSGGNVFQGAARNFLLFQTGAHGEGALAVDFVCDELINQLLFKKGGYFSAHLFDANMGLVIGETITEMVQGRSDSVADSVRRAASDRPSVWDRALGTALSALEPNDNPKEALNVLVLKGRAIARSILDGLGREKTAALLAELVNRHRGGHFDAGDLATIAAELDADLEPLIGDWLNEAALPGFIASPVRVERLVDDDQGNPRYQTRVHIRNEESTPGLLRLRYATGEAERDSDWHQTEPVRVAGNTSVEVGMLSSTPMRQLWMQPYLSLNREDIQLTLPRVDQEEQIRVEPLLGERASDWLPAEDDAIVVDDLDEGFSVATEEEETGFRLSGGLSSFFQGEIDMDQGLPEYREFAGPPKEWSRREMASSWGKYRHTVALVSGGSGRVRASFTADLPRSGEWRLEYHLPEMTTQRRTTQGGGVRISAQTGLGGTQGTYDVSLLSGGEERSLEFDASAAEIGWNSLGVFDLSAGEVQVSVSNETSGRMVVADAIRWRSLSEDG